MFDKNKPERLTRVLANMALKGESPNGQPPLVLEYPELSMAVVRLCDEIELIERSSGPLLTELARTLVVALTDHKFDRWEELLRALDTGCVGALHASTLRIGESLGEIEAELAQIVTNA